MLWFESGGRVIDVAVFRPDDGGKHPAVNYLHRGGFSLLDPVMARFYAAGSGRSRVRG